MNTVIKWSMRIIAFICVLAILAAIFGYYMMRRSLPDYQPDEPIETTEYQAEILRDLNAIPHIFSKQNQGSLYALGYAHAQDRLWQMTFLRRVAQGRISEIIGPDMLETDYFLRSLDMWNLAQENYRQSDAETQGYLRAYADGVNAYLANVNENSRGAGAPEFLILGRQLSPWLPADSIAIQKVMALQLSHGAEHEIQRALFSMQLSPRDLDELFYTTPQPFGVANMAQSVSPPNAAEPSPASQSENEGQSDPDTDTSASLHHWRPFGTSRESGASNAFISAPARSATGAAILGNDPHLALTAPSILYLAHIQIDGQDVIGATIPGIPSIIIGHNGKLSWGLTTSYLDDQDLVVLKRDPNDSSQIILENNQREKLKTQEILIQVKGQNEPEVFTREISSFGPIIPPNGPWGVERIQPQDHAIALSWTALADDDTSIQAGIQLMMAKDVFQAEKVLANYVAPSQMFSLADSDGNIAQIAAGRMPKRSPKNDSRGILPAASWLGSAGFVGYFDYRQNPRNINPKTGLLYHTNNKFIDAPYPEHWSNNWGDKYRIQRAVKLLGNRKFHSLQSFIEAQNDVISNDARVILPLSVREFWFDPNNSGQMADALNMLGEWNGAFEARRSEPLIYAAWLEELNRLVFSDELGELYQDMGRVDPMRLERVFRNVDGNARWCDIRPTPELESCADISETAMKIALEKLTKIYGAQIETWRWGHAHRAVHENEVLTNLPMIGGFSNIVQEQSGGVNTLLRSAYPGGEDYNFTANHGAVYRMVVDFSQIAQSKYILSTGQSGHWLSPYYDDLSTLWRNGEYIDMTTNRDVIEGNILGHTIFEPISAE